MRWRAWSAPRGPRFFQSLIAGFLWQKFCGTFSPSSHFCSLLLFDRHAPFLIKRPFLFCKNGGLLREKNYRTAMVAFLDFLPALDVHVTAGIAFGKSVQAFWRTRTSDPTGAVYGVSPVPATCPADLPHDGNDCDVRRSDRTER